MASDSDPKKWVMPDHTRAKHQILRRYLQGWFPVLGQTHGRIVFLDGFAGRGKYVDGSPGSPIIALQELLDHTFFPRLKHREFVFLFVEHDDDNVASLRTEVAAFVASRQPWPANVKYDIIPSTFEQVADEIVDELRRKQANMAPLFAFVDPFGFSGLPMRTLAALTAWPRAELCVNFAVNNVNRFLEHDDVRTHLEELFGCSRDEVLRAVQGTGPRVPRVRETYGDRLRTVAGFPYVQSFEMRNASGNVSYFLFHATRHPKGVALMKDAMWKLDPSGGFSFSDRLAGLEVLFQPEPNLTPLRRHLQAEYHNKGPVRAEQVKDAVNLHTPYRQPHLTAALKAMEAEHVVGVNRPGKTGYPDGTVLVF